MEKKDKLDWSIVSKYRNEMFGIAIISIILFHYFADVITHNVKGVTGFIAKGYNFTIGPTGVEIFIFLSGMGLCFSMNKNSSIKRFYVARLKRVLVPYCIWGFPFFIVKDIVFKKAGFKRVLYDFFFVSFVKEGVVNLWFIAFIIMAYLIYPIIHRCFKLDNRYRRYLLIIMMVFNVVATSVLARYIPTYVENTRLALYRIPIFLLGAYYGQKIYAKERFNKVDMSLVVIGLVTKIVFLIFRNEPFITANYIASEYVNCLFSFAEVIILVLILSKIKISFINKMLIAIGGLSLELYMTHVNTRLIMIYMGYTHEKLYMYLICIAIASIFSVILHYVCRLLLAWRPPCKF